MLSQKKLDEASDRIPQTYQPKKRPWPGLPGDGEDEGEVARAQRGEDARQAQIPFRRHPEEDHLQEAGEDAEPDHEAELLGRDQGPVDRLAEDQQEDGDRHL